MTSTESHSYTINGINVLFPCKAYPSQLSMMDKIIKGIDRRQNCLLESPTGSGKSLALLCSALAWQTNERERLRKEEKNQKDSSCPCMSKSDIDETTDDQSGYLISTHQPLPLALLQTTISRMESYSCMPAMIEDDDLKGVQMVQMPVNGECISRQLDIGTPMKSTPPDDACCCQCDEQTTSTNGKRRVPKIYFGTRTHKQISQIAKELGKTAYRHTRMTILGSREHTCINPEVSRLPNKNEECKNKLDGPGCRYFDGVRKISHQKISDKGLSSAWNLEEFIGVCKKQKACPYFAARQLKDNADIIFCPYNYLIDPLIRNSMEISLKGHIVILDEAHNIEDSSRDAASFSISQDKLKDAMTDMEIFIKDSVKPEENRELYKMLNSFNEFIVSNVDGLNGDFDHASRVWSGVDIVATLTHTGVGPSSFHHLQECFQIIVKEEEERRESAISDGMRLKSATLQCFSGLFMVLGYIYRNDMKYLDDYKVAVVRSMEYGYPANTSSLPTENIWISRRRRGSRQLNLCYTLHFWCLNPAVAFSDINDVRSVVLTSGTLSPMNTFQSELSVPFPIQLEANHIITDAQVWVGTISQGPRGASLLGSYQNSETYSYQDEVGDVVLRVCQTIPHGVLCFLPSYKSMEKLTNRWKNTGLWERLIQYKHVMVEPRASDKVDFDVLIKQYYDLISGHQATEDSRMTGALFLGVCRGKVSEGLDFADNNARAVISVGIPFPNIKDTQIELKKQYNDQHCAERGLLRGRDWYEIQAYRAINQALGRCIRHRNDWGALILVDERYGKNPQRYIKGLSKWVRKRVQYYSTFQQAENSLKAFTRERLENGCCVKASLASAASNSTSIDTVENSSVLTPQAGVSSSVDQSFVLMPTANGLTPTNQQKQPCSPVVRKANQQPATRIANQQAAFTPSPSCHRSLGGNTMKNIPLRYINQSQAGGFIPSQINGSDLVGSMNPLVQAYPVQTQILVGHSTQPVREILEAGEAVVNFNPTMTSTQAAGTGIDTDVSNGALPSAITIHQNVGNTSAGIIQSEDPGGKNGTDRGQGRVNFKPVMEGALYQEQESRRADSPTLFDSDDDNKQKLDMRWPNDDFNKPLTNGDRLLEENKLDGDGSDDGVQVTNHSLAVTHKLIFKKRPTAEPGQLSDLDTSSRNRLSLSKLKPDTDVIDTTTESKVLGDFGRNITTEWKALEESGNYKRQLVNDSMKLEYDLKQEHNDFKENEDGKDVDKLNIKRKLRGKKKRSGDHGNVRMTKKRGVVFTDDDDDDDDDVVSHHLVKELTFNCPQCRTKLLTFSGGYRKESYRPAFVKMITSSTQHCPVGDMVTISNEQLPDDAISVITTQGPLLNSYWSREDDCVVQYLTCQRCMDAARSSGTAAPPYLGVHVLMMGKPTPRLKPGQVWLLPQYLKT